MSTPEEKIANSNFADEVFLTREQLCKRLQVTQRTMLNWHRDNLAPPFVKIGGAVRYPEKFLDKWIEQQLVA